jgi:hypothetical protein
MRRAIRECIQKFPDWPPGARTANGTALCHYIQLYRYFVSQSSSFAAIALFVSLSTQTGKCWIYPGLPTV